MVTFVLMSAFLVVSLLVAFIVHSPSAAIMDSSTGRRATWQGGNINRQAINAQSDFTRSLTEPLTQGHIRYRGAQGPNMSESGTVCRHSIVQPLRTSDIL